MPTPQCGDTRVHCYNKESCRPKTHSHSCQLPNVGTLTYIVVSGGFVARNTPTLTPALQCGDTNVHCSKRAKQTRTVTSTPQCEDTRAHCSNWGRCSPETNPTQTRALAWSDAQAQRNILNLFGFYILNPRHEMYSTLA